jgi:nucleotide-binding universal stress UspA family protein
MIRHILLAVDDSAASLAAARVAVEIAAATGATVEALHVLEDGEVAAALRAAACTGMPSTAAAESLLARVSWLAADSGVSVRSELTTGEPARWVLDHARSWPADLVVLGRTSEHGVDMPAIGRHVRHVLEFAELPVLVVPAPVCEPGVPPGGAAQAVVSSTHTGPAASGRS